MITKVAKILSETELVLSAGHDKGIVEGMEFVIFEEGDEINDPETEASLGKLEIIKGYVTVVNVQQKLSIAKTHTHSIMRTRQVQTSTLSSALSGLLGVPREERYEVETVDKLKIENPDRDYSKKLIVRVGDLAKLTR